MTTWQKTSRQVAPQRSDRPSGEAHTEPSRARANGHTRHHTPPHGGGRLFATDDRWTLFALRISLALVIFPHGAQKLLGWFSGFGFEGTMAFFTDTMGIPYLFGLLAVIAEFFGPLALAAGLLTRLAAFGIGTVMVVAALTSHVEYGFFMNWYGQQAGEGFEYHLLALGIALALLIGGGGAASVDRLLTRRLRGNLVSRAERRA